MDSQFKEGKSNNVIATKRKISTSLDIFDRILHEATNKFLQPMDASIMDNAFHLLYHDQLTEKQIVRFQRVFKTPMSLQVIF